MTDPVTALVDTPAAAPPTPAASVKPAIVAALESAALTAAQSLEANAIAYLNGLEAKAKSELGVVESKVAAVIAKVKAYAKYAIPVGVLGGAGYVAAHFLHL